MSRGRPVLLALGVGVAAVVLGSVALRTGVAEDPAAGSAGSSTAGAAAGRGEDDASDQTDPGESASPEVRSIEVETSQARRAGSARANPPQGLRLPGTGWLDVEAVGTHPSGLLDVPKDVDRIGWWEGGARIGDPFGSVLLAGHVDSATQGLGPSAALLSVARGADVSVRTASRTTRWEVSSRRLVPLDHLTRYPRLLSPKGPARLTMVTCAPPFVASHGGYQNLAIVEARPVEGPERSRPR